MPNAFAERVNLVFFRYGRFCASHSVSLLLWSIFVFLLLLQPVLRVSFLSSITFESRVMPEVSHAQHDPVGGYVLQLIGTLSTTSRKRWTLDDVLGASNTLSNTIAGAGIFSELTPRLQCRTLLQELNAYGESSSQPDCLFVFPTDLTRADIELAFTERGWWQSLKSLSRIPGRPTLLTTAMEIVFDRHREYSGKSGSFSGQFTAAVILKEPPSVGFRNALCRHVKLQLNVSDCQISNSGAYVSNHYRSASQFRRAMFSVPLSYSLLVFYVYFTVSKINMVTSKWGLALSAIMTCFMSLIGAAGLCVHFGFLPTIWVAEYFPYLAMMVGLENTLCITRSVVSMPVRLPPKDRLAYGLSLEGWSLIKNSLTHMVIIVVGWLTFVPDIQEFMAFGSIGFVMDFSMQLFFYSPCLYFDLRRLDPDKLEEFRREQLTMQPVSLQNYPSRRCPIARRYPNLAAIRAWVLRLATFRDDRLKRYRSESALEASQVAQTTLRHSPTSPQPSMEFRCHRRTHSQTQAAFVQDSDRKSADSPSPGDFTVSRRFRLMRFWTSNRLLTKFLMVLICSWIVWLALFVHQLHELNVIAKNFDRVDVSEKLAEIRKEAAAFRKTRLVTPGKSDLEFRKEFGNCWAQLYDSLGYDLSGRNIIIAPSIFVDFVVPDQSGPGDTVYDSSHDVWIYWPSLIFIVAGITFLSVGFLVVYALWSPRQGTSDLTFRARIQQRKVSRKRTGSKEIVESIPIIFKGHEWPVECLVLDTRGTVAVSASVSRILVWDPRTGDCLRNLKGSMPRLSTMDSDGLDTFAAGLTLDVPESPSIWCIALNEDARTLAVSYDNGSLALWNIHSDTEVYRIQSEGDKNGITLMQWADERNLMAVRFPGSLEFYEYQKAAGVMLARRRMTAHQHVINKLVTAGQFVYTGSEDRTIKSFVVANCQHVHTFYGHIDSVVQLLVDYSSEMMCSSDLGGLVCTWDRYKCQLCYTLTGISPPIALSLSSLYLIGKTADGMLYLWERSTGAEKSTIKLGQDKGAPGTQGLVPDIPEDVVLLSDDYLVLSWGGRLHLWDINHKLLLREANVDVSNRGFPLDITHVVKIDGSSVMCTVDRFLYRVNMPLIPVKC